MGQSEYGALLRSHHNLRAEYQQLLSLTAELTGGLERVARDRLGTAGRDLDWSQVDRTALH